MGPKTLLVATVTFASLVGSAMTQSATPALDKWQAPSDAAAKPNPESQKPGAAATGRKLFLRICARCHEEDGSGQNEGAANLRCPPVQSQSDGAFFWKITNGNTRKGMPPFAALPENVRWDIVTFLRSLKDPKCDKPHGSQGDTKESSPNPGDQKSR